MKRLLVAALLSGCGAPTPDHLENAAPNVYGYCTLLIDGQMYRWRENRDGWCVIESLVGESWSQGLEDHIRTLLSADRAMMEMSAQGSNGSDGREV